ncbi:nicotinamide-nucleotide amidase [Gillisia sp. Hel_I_86]|uniref:competence/damage-inducible protein A n=1 Tax=Gillisia sp. Hel_I_86 TaxID=1249981 RepID=UPI001198ECAC|nr:competence/damage-inducible protein A [Gillisia sp. Hel_I_86]TVZ25419.1 nicotinamide-nucleotide amidase [Gillisia sp. Hel_I_86]
MIAEIITIGDEILIGQIVDTNSAHIAQELNKIGISVHQITSVKDEHDHILTTLKEAYSRADVILITGGLGPTKDDITKKVLCEFFEDSLIKDEHVLRHIESIFAKYVTTPISDLNREQALIPSKAIALHNEYGTAPGLWMKKDNKVFIALPGVPFEMKSLMEREVLPRLIKEFKRPFIYHKTIRTYGLGESAIAQRIEDWENNLPSHIKLAYLPSFGTVRLRLSGKGQNEAALKTSIDKEFEKIYPILHDIISDVNGENEDIAITINELLRAKSQFLSVAESCTGGELATKFTKNPGASTSFKGGIVVYATESKEDILKVPHELIEEKSVVSAEVAEEMARNSKLIFKSDYAISTTGNAGPEKGESDAEVGTVFIGIATPDKVFAQEFKFSRSREQVIQKTVNKALEMLLKELLSK